MLFFNHRISYGSPSAIGVKVLMVASGLFHPEALAIYPSTERVMSIRFTIAVEAIVTPRPPGMKPTRSVTDDHTRGRQRRSCQRVPGVQNLTRRG